MLQKTKTYESYIKLNKSMFLRASLTAQNAPKMSGGWAFPRPAGELAALLQTHGFI